MERDLYGKKIIDKKYKLGMPYQGRKTRINHIILKTIYETLNKDNFIFYDLFGGGGSISLIANHMGHETYYNEYNKAITELFKYLCQGNTIPYQWISKKEFENQQNKDNWQAGYTKIAYSFGNNMINYAYSKENQEKIKEKTQKYIKTGEKQGLIQAITSTNTLNKITTDKKAKNIKIYNKSYEKVKISEKSVIYCDIPYKNTGKYNKQEFNHEKFYEWAEKHPQPVFISEYGMPEEFQCIKEIQKYRLFSRGNIDKTKTEKIYWNKQEL